MATDESPKKTPVVEGNPQSATDVLTEFLIANKIELLTDEVANNLLTMSDGSLVVKKPAIRARYIK